MSTQVLGQRGRVTNAVPDSMSVRASPPSPSNTWPKSVAGFCKSQSQSRRPHSSLSSSTLAPRGRVGTRSWDPRPSVVAVLVVMKVEVVGVGGEGGGSCVEAQFAHRHILPISSPPFSCSLVRLVCSCYRRFPPHPCDTHTRTHTHTHTVGAISFWLGVSEEEVQAGLDVGFRGDGIPTPGRATPPPSHSADRLLTTPRTIGTRRRSICRISNPAFNPNL
jgi:hypothetical protein